MVPASQLRPSPIAGVWYEDDPEQLALQIDRYLQQAPPPDLDGEVVALVAPHAGHRYSGRTAGHAFRCVVGLSFDLVVVLSPMHQYHPAPLLTSAHQGYQTPLGPLWIDQQAVLELDQALQKQHALELAFIANDREHALEIELPFLQRALRPGFRLLPLMIHTLSEAVTRAVGTALADLLRGRSALLVASSDLSHFFPRGAAAQLDGVLLDQVARLSPEGVLRAERSGSGHACGAAAIAAVLWAATALGADHAEILHYSTSAEETGDEQSVVGYGAAAVLKRA